MKNSKQKSGKSIIKKTVSMMLVLVLCLSTVITAFADSAYTTNERLNLNGRSGPGTGYSIVIKIPPNSSVETTGSVKNGFTQIKYKGTKCWVSSEYVSYSGRTAYTTNTKLNLNMRASASSSGKVVKKIPTLSTITVYGGATNGFYYALYNGTKGYVSAEYVSFSKPDTEDGWQMPMKNAYHTWGNGNSWGADCNSFGRNNGGGRNYHNAVDINSSSDKNVYAAAGGTVAKTGTNSVNGKYVIIRHSLSGKTVYTFYAHLKSVNTTAGSKVSAGDKIGVVGNSGSGAGSTVHLHFAVVDSLSGNGGYYGYVTKFSGNKVTYSGRTYYNPVYIVNNNRLP